jgi:hypothetical protein
MGSLKTPPCGNMIYSYNNIRNLFYFFMFQQSWFGRRLNIIAFYQVSRVQYMDNLMSAYQIQLCPMNSLPTKLLKCNERSTENQVRFLDNLSCQVLFRVQSKLPVVLKGSTFYN